METVVEIVINQDDFEQAFREWDVKIHGTDIFIDIVDPLFEEGK